MKLKDVSEVCNASIALMMETVRTSETSVCFISISRRYIPEGCHLQTQCDFYGAYTG
jgi:hypothetical protein